MPVTSLMKELIPAKEVWRVEDRILDGMSMGKKLQMDMTSRKGKGNW